MKKSKFFINIKEILEVVLIVVVLRSFVIQLFTIPSGSMYPTLVVGDYLYVTKYSYGISRYSFPFGKYWLPDFGRIFYTEPKRGDVVVFRVVSTGDDYIKRIIGMGGDTIQLKQGLLYINDKPVKKVRLDNTVAGSGTIPTYKETLPNGKSYKVWEQSGNESMSDNTQKFVVPKNHFFMLGDNRDSSADSRFLPVGYVSYDALIGPARNILFSLDKASVLEFWKWYSNGRGERAFKSVN